MKCIVCDKLIKKHQLKKSLQHKMQKLLKERFYHLGCKIDNKLTYKV